jgi:hypothetical protein
MGVWKGDLEVLLGDSPGRTNLVVIEVTICSFIYGQRDLTCRSYNVPEFRSSDSHCFFLPQTDHITPNFSTSH